MPAGKVKRILTTHTGSLPRPHALNLLYVRRQRGEVIDDQELQEAVNAAIQSVVAHERDCGIDIANDGEQQREAYFLYMQRRLSGFGGSWTRPALADVLHYPEFARRMRERLSSGDLISGRDAPMAVGEVRYLGSGAVKAELDTFHAVLEEAGQPFSDVFVTAPSPGIVAAGMKNNHYASDKAYLAALSDAMSHEYRAIVDGGFLLQVDCPDLAVERHATFRDKPLSEFLAFAENAVEALNAALKALPRDRVRVHVCWGNYEGPHDQDVPLEDILPVIQEADVGTLVLPFANPRHAHEVRCLKKLKPKLAVVAGVVDPLTNFVEHSEVVAERLIRVAEELGDASRVTAGCDCGFDSASGAGRVAEDVVWAKLRSLSDGAAIASRRLFAL